MTVHSHGMKRDREVIARSKGKLTFKRLDEIRESRRAAWEPEDPLTVPIEIRLEEFQEEKYWDALHKRRAAARKGKAKARCTRLNNKLNALERYYVGWQQSMTPH